MELVMKKSTDRRAKQRFMMRREMRFKAVDDRVVIATGAGETVNIGSGGVAFAADSVLPIGTFMELSISWPVLLDESCPMRLIVFGRVIRTHRPVTICTVDKYEFRTQARTSQTSQTLTAVRADDMLRRWSDAVRSKVPGSFKASTVHA